MELHACMFVYDVCSLPAGTTVVNVGVWYVIVFDFCCALAHASCMHVGVSVLSCCIPLACRHYGREIGAWNIESGKQHVFGEDAGYPKCVMLIYTGTHYDALAIAKVGSRYMLTPHALLSTPCTESAQHKLRLRHTPAKPPCQTTLPNHHASQTTMLCNVYTAWQAKHAMTQ